jgi:hypothetical protein
MLIMKQASASAMASDPNTPTGTHL